MAPASPQLDVLKFDILLQICLLVGHIPQEDYRQVEQHRLRPLSMVNKRFRDVCIPLLFRRSSVTVYLSWVVARPWQSTLETITRMDNSLVLGRHVRYEFLLYFPRTHRGRWSLAYIVHRALQFQIEINYSRPEECYIAGKAPPEDLPQLLARVLARMTCLEQLAFNLPTDHTGIFAEKFAEAQLVLPLVRKLDIANMCGFLVKMCPNVKEIQNWRCPYGQKKTTPDFLNGIANASKLEIFTKRDFWTADFLKGKQEVHLSPNLKAHLRPVVSTHKNLAANICCRNGKSAAPNLSTQSGRCAGTARSEHHQGEKTRAFLMLKN